jgi:hypothetical protein
MRAQGRRGLFRWLDRRRVEKLLGVPLPAQAGDLRYYIWRPSTDLALYDAYITFRSSYAAYLDLVRRRKLILFKDGGPTAHLPTAWKQSDEFGRLQWWDPSPDTPMDAASGSVGAYGWIVAKYERGHVYVMISDSGHTEVIGH